MLTTKSYMLYVCAVVSLSHETSAKQKILTESTSSYKDDNILSTIYEPSVHMMRCIPRSGPHFDFDNANIDQFDRCSL